MNVSPPLRAIGSVIFSAIAALALLLPAASAQAQQTTSVGSLYLSNGAELDFGLFGASGGAGTNGANSDRIASATQFNYSSSSAGTYIVGFSHGDTNALAPGSIYTLVTFASTNFLATDANRFTAAPRGNVNAVSGNFILNPSDNGGTLQFIVTGEQDMPEPPTLLLLATSTMGIIGLIIKRRNQKDSPRG